MSQATGIDVGRRKNALTCGGELAIHLLGLLGSLGVIRCRDHPKPFTLSWKEHCGCQL